MYTKLIKKTLINQQLIRTPKGITYRVAEEDGIDRYSYDEYWSYISREGGCRR